MTLHPEFVFHLCSEKRKKVQNELLHSLSPLQGQLCALLKSSQELLSQGVFCPKLLWQEYRRDQVCVRGRMLYVMSAECLLLISNHL